MNNQLDHFKLNIVYIILKENKFVNVLLSLTAEFLSVFTETEDFGDLQKHAEDHTAGTKRGRQEVP